MDAIRITIDLKKADYVDFMDLIMPVVENWKKEKKDKYIRIFNEDISIIE